MGYAGQFRCRLLPNFLWKANTDRRSIDSTRAATIYLNLKFNQVGRYTFLQMADCFPGVFCSAWCRDLPTHALYLVPRILLDERGTSREKSCQERRRLMLICETLKIVERGGVTSLPEARETIKTALARSESAAWITNFHMYF